MCRRRFGRRTRVAGLPPRRQGFPRIPAPGNQRGIRAGAHRAQDGPRLSRLRVRLFARRHDRAGPRTARPDDQCARPGRERHAHRSMGRPRRPREPGSAARLGRVCRGPRAYPARRALRRAIPSPRLRGCRRDDAPHAAHGRGRRSRRPGSGPCLERDRARARRP